ncbi:MAG: hypothetical protein CVU05_15885 [Bacteroidetes bacterium HGW-Bacteroidetes-21]|nr:MAG: hypothetical protein CVU05_15885 [Bacteroidetes bacterium HGW-Bacteroidetes-21]
MNQQILERLGCTVFYVSLSQITRQSLDSGILVNATRLRTGLELSMFNRISFTVAGYPDIRRTDSKDIQQEIESCYDKYGMDETVIICRSNKMANKYNEFIRNRILYREEALSCSDKLLVVKNNYFWLPENENTEFIANGDFVILRKIRRIHEMHGFNFADCTVDFPDYNMEFEVKLLLESIRAEGPGISADQSRELYNAVSLDYSHIANKRKRYEKLLEDPYYNALQTKMGYAMTCHKAQGGQWKAVFVDFSFFSQDSDNPETFRWLYTAITRATERLYLVNFKDMYFDNED